MSRLRYFLILIVIVITSILLHYVGVLRPIENILFRILTPIEKSLYNSFSFVSQSRQNWVNHRSVISDNEQLRQQLEYNYVDRSLLNTLTAENQLLREELEFKESRQLNTVAAEIVTGVSDPISQAVIINRGKSDGVEVGYAVVSGGGALIGKVVETYETISKVLLLTDTTSKVAATIQNQTQTAGLIEGQFGLSIAMTDIPQDQDIKTGDLIITSGLEGQIPRGLLIAYIESVSQIESAIFKTAVLTPVASFKNLSHVLVIIP
jgi:rod shape-determining protein MreC